MSVLEQIDLLTKNKLKTIYIKNCTDDNINLLIDNLKNNTSVTEIILPKGYFSSNSLILLCNAIIENSIFRDSIFTDTELTDEILKSSYISTLDISNRKIRELTNDACDAIGKLLENNRLLYLNLEHTWINERNISNIIDKLKENNSLYELNLSDNNIGDYGLYKLKEYFDTKKTYLNTLILKNIGRYKVNNMISLLNLLKTNTSLQTLNISSNIIHEENSINILADLLTQNTTLTDLNISGTDVAYKNMSGISILKKLCINLKSNNTLTKLDLGYNYIDDNDLTSLINSLNPLNPFSINNSLSILHLNNNQIHISKASKLLTNKNIIELDLSSDFISSVDDMKIFCNELKKNNTLTALYLDNCKIDDEMASELCETLKTNSSLTTLSLKNNLISDGKIISDLIKVNSTLTNLDLFNNSLNMDDIMYILDSLRLNESIISLNLQGNYFKDIDKLIITPDGVQYKEDYTYTYTDGRFIYESSEDESEGELSGGNNLNDYYKLMQNINKILNRNKQLKLSKNVYKNKLSTDINTKQSGGSKISLNNYYNQYKNKYYS